jgi:hypothetical protein
MLGPVVVKIVVAKRVRRDELGASAAECLMHQDLVFLRGHAVAGDRACLGVADFASAKRVGHQRELVALAMMAARVAISSPSASICSRVRAGVASMHVSATTVFWR